MKGRFTSLGITIAMFVSFIGYNIWHDRVRTGDVWRYKTTHVEEAPPFDDCNSGGGVYYIDHTYRVLDVKDGWVKYADERGRVSCQKKNLFVAGADRIGTFK